MINAFSISTVYYDCYLSKEKAIVNKIMEKIKKQKKIL